jgi:TolB-like protein/Flp pilus assembly protein TadD
MSFFNELKRRNVFKVGLAYAVASWLLLQIVDLVLENIYAPDWIMQVFMLALAVGFPIAVIIAWAFEVTPDGVKRERDVDRSQSIVKQTGQHLNRGIMMILAVAVVFLLTERFRDNIFEEPEVTTPVIESTSQSKAKDSNVSIAVLPFRDMSSAQDQAYFGEGIAEELLNALVKVEGLDVASRTSAFSIVDENLDIPAIAAKLGVAHILEGSIRTSGQHVRVTAQLIEVSQDVHLWSETYDGSLDDIFKIQDEITGKIVEALKVQFGDVEPVSFAQRLTANAEAYQHYLHGRHLWRQRNAPGLREAIRLFKLAVELDPKFHQAWSNLALAYFNLADYDSSFKSEQGFTLGLAAAEKALAIEPQSTEAIIIKADDAFFHCDQINAANLFEKAIAVNPNDPTAHHWYSILLSHAGRADHSLEQIQIAKKIDPLISAVIATEADAHALFGDYARALQMYEQAERLGLIENGLISYSTLIAIRSGDLEKARSLIEQSPALPDARLMEERQRFLDAIGNPDGRRVFEQAIGEADESDVYQTLEYVSLLADLGSSFVFEYQSNLDCPLITDIFWMEPFREQRGTSEFFELIERGGFVDYWRKHGWPDDCTSLDQSLAECP